MHKILLIEDDEIIVRMYKRSLILRGYAVEVAHNGAEGYLKAKSFKPNLILLDVMMPQVNGLETLKKLKEDPITKDCPVIMLTNLDMQDDVEYSLKNGAVKYLIKSNYEAVDIIRIIQEFLSHPRTHQNEEVSAITQ